MTQETFAVGIDLGGTSIKYAVVSSSGDILWQSKRPSLAQGSREGIIQNLIEAAIEAIGQAAKQNKKITCIGIGTPGLVNPETGLVMGGAFNLTDWTNVPLAERVSAATKLPVFVDNDANLMGMGEYGFGGNQGCNKLIFITVGTGIGGAIFIDGKLYRGHRHAGNELGTLMMTYKGKDGYWEDFASTAAMVKQYEERLEEPHHAQTIDGKYIYEKFQTGDALATEIFTEHTRLMGYGLAGFINIFNPEKIIIGGGISESGPSYISLVKKAAFSYAMEDCSLGVEIEAAKMGNNAGFLGAAYFALKELS